MQLGRASAEGQASSTPSSGERCLTYLLEIDQRVIGLLTSMICMLILS